MSIPGVDYAWQHPDPAALQRAGKRFAARYLSTDTSKNLTRAEADALAAHGISSVVVWETTAQRAAAGRSAGIADAERAEAQARGAGMPPTRPIYFAVDYDAAPSAVVAYFQGVASVLGLARTGVYGGYRVVAYLLDHKLAAWAWQTAAWSGGKWDPRLNIRQGNFVTIGAVQCDADTALTSDYGQWTPGKTPTPEDPTDMADITPAQMDQIARKTADLLVTPEYRDALAVSPLYWASHALDPDAVLPAGKDAPGAAVQAAALRTALAKHASGTGITDTQLDSLAGRIVTALVGQAKA